MPISGDRNLQYPWAWMCGLVLAVVVQLISDTVAAEATPPAGAETASETIFVASNGWHSAIFVSRGALTPDILPEIIDFPKARYVGFGWGDADYFPARDPGISILLSAALLPTSSVLHVTGLRVHPDVAYPNDEVIALNISRAAFRKLVSYIDNAFARGTDRTSKPVAPGRDSYSKFYRARGEFHLFNTCNSWTARGLVAAEVPLDPVDLIRAEGLMAQLRALTDAAPAKSFK